MRPSRLLRAATMGGGLLWAALSCSRPAPETFTATHQQALADTVLTLYDSLSAIHSGHPDTGILRRLHPPADTLVFIEGGLVEALTGDSLFRRVLVLHIPVHMMLQRFTDRRAHLLDRDLGVLNAVETVEWADMAGQHEWHGLLTLVVSRRGDRWVIRAYRG